MSGSIPTWAVKGQKVVCVFPTDERDAECEGRPEIEVGGVYTIGHGGVFVAYWDDIYLSLLERHPDSAFDIRCFRPLITRTLEQDIALFRDIADKAGAPSELTDSDLERMAHDAVFGNPV